MFIRQLVQKSIKTPVSQRFISRSAPRLGGNHGHVEYTGDGNYPPFTTGLWVGGMLVVGGGATIAICAYQNYKHGFPHKKDE